ncbi:Hypothetical protein RAK1035_1740 [Roseovarius sp. AK1035]|nr:Hypothetical protein RAK1035_1740 [Roseovarius sp. AK1035]
MSKGVEAHARGSFGADLAPARPGLKLIWRAFVANRRSMGSNRSSLCPVTDWRSCPNQMRPGRSKMTGAARKPC